MGIKFNKNRVPLAVEQNNYTIKVLNAYIVYDLDALDAISNLKIACLVRLIY